MSKYLVRLDDACPFMDSGKWIRMEVILDRYGVKPLVGVIPDNADPKIKIDPIDTEFWDKTHRWMEKGWQIALHGYDHICISNEGMKGLNPVWRRSEFAGLPLQCQCEKIKRGMGILKEKGISPLFFFAPSHTFDNNTLKALESESDIRVICDTVALRPYKKGIFYYIPQISGHCIKLLFPGVYTFCFHPNTMKDKDFRDFEMFLSENCNHFISFSDIDLSKVGNISMTSRIVSFFYFLYRKMRGLK